MPLIALRALLPPALADPGQVVAMLVMMIIMMIVVMIAMMILITVVMIEKTKIEQQGAMMIVILLEFRSFPHLCTSSGRAGHTMLANIVYRSGSVAVTPSFEWQ